MRCSSILAIVLLLVLSAFTQAKREEPDIQGQGGREVFATLVNYFEALRTQSPELLDRVIAEELVVTRHDGTIYERREALELIKNKSPWRIVSTKNENVRVRAYGKAAFATGLLQISEVSGEKNRSTATRFTAVFVKKANRWRLCALQAALVSEQ